RPELISEVGAAGRLRATTSSERAVAASEMSLICVGTPSRANGALDVEAVVRTGHSIGEALRGRADPHTVVLRSTVLPGTVEGVLIPALLARAGGRVAIQVAVNPEFMREGSSLRPGFAFGGSCLPKDLRALLHAARAADISLPLLEAILPSNGMQIRRGVEAVLAAQKRRVGVVGLAFKPGTDDLRESPMIAVV